MVTAAVAKRLEVLYFMFFFSFTSQVINHVLKHHHMEHTSTLTPFLSVESWCSWLSWGTEEAKSMCFCYPEDSKVSVSCCWAANWANFWPLFYRHLIPLWPDRSSSSSQGWFLHLEKFIHKVEPSVVMKHHKPQRGQAEQLEETESRPAKTSKCSGVFVL